MVPVILFIFGAAIGSFLNVVALRYEGERFLFDPNVIGGRSHCPHCKRTLAWFELIPIVSFLIQGGRCRNCKARIGFQYPSVELLSGIIFAAVPLQFAYAIPQSIIWIAALEILLLISYVDILLGIIPDELNVALLVVGILNLGVASGALLLNHLGAAILAAAFFGGLVAVTRGKGMGMGDVKLALPLGFLFGLPAILLLTALAFIIGGAYGAVVIALGEKTMKSSVPFGPFLAVAAAITFFWGSNLVQWYFHMIGL